MRPIVLLGGIGAIVAAGAVWFLSSSGGDDVVQDPGAPPAVSDSSTTTHAASDATGSAEAPAIVSRSGDVSSPASNGRPDARYAGGAARELFDPVCQSDGYVTETCTCLYNRLVSYAGTDAPALIGLMGYDRFDDADDLKKSLGEELSREIIKMYAEGEYKACSIIAGPGTEAGGDARKLQTGDPLPDRPLTPAEKFAQNCPEGTPSVPEELGHIAAVYENGVRLSRGQNQRVGIARALVAEPACLLFDEPVGGAPSIDNLELGFADPQLQDFRIAVWAESFGNTVEEYSPGDLISLSDELTVVGVPKDQTIYGDLTFQPIGASGGNATVYAEHVGDAPLLFRDYLGNKSPVWQYEVAGVPGKKDLEVGEVTKVEDGKIDVDCNKDVTLECIAPPKLCRFPKGLLEAARFEVETRAYLSGREVVQKLGGCQSPDALQMEAIEALTKADGSATWRINITRDEPGDLVVLDLR